MKDRKERSFGLCGTMHHRRHIISGRRMQAATKLDAKM
jgi:hypothetical protein